MLVRYYITYNDIRQEVDCDYFYKQVDNEIDAIYEITATLESIDEQL